MGPIETLFNRHKLVRRLLLLWAVCLISFVVVAFVAKMGSIQTADATVIVAVIGILATVLGLYQWSREREDRNAGP